MPVADSTERDYAVRETFHRIADGLAVQYGEPVREPLPLGNKPAPLDELIYIMLTVMTEFGVDDVYNNLRERYPTWEKVANAPSAEIEALLQPIGLSRQRAARITNLLQEIRRREGVADLSRLEALPDDEVEAYLTTLPGVGKKVARCVMLYSLGRSVFPVDAHVLRVLQRLNVAPPSLTLHHAQDFLQDRIPEVLRYTLHVNLVVHGRTTCRARKPRCTDCPLARLCPSANS